MKVGIVSQDSVNIINSLGIEKFTNLFLFRTYLKSTQKEIDVLCCYAQDSNDMYDVQPLLIVVNNDIFSDIACTQEIADQLDK